MKNGNGLKDILKFECTGWKGRLSVDVRAASKQDAAALGQLKLKVKCSERVEVEEVGGEEGVYKVTMATCRPADQYTLKALCYAMLEAKSIEFD